MPSVYRCCCRFGELTFPFGQAVIGDSLIVQGKKGTLAKALKSKKFINTANIKVTVEMGV